MFAPASVPGTSTEPGVGCQARLHERVLGRAVDAHELHVDAGQAALVARLTQQPAWRLGRRNEDVHVAQVVEPRIMATATNLLFDGLVGKMLGKFLPAGTTQAQAEQLRRLLPDVRIIVGHGQMPEGTLERVMLAFAEGEAREVTLHDGSKLVLKKLGKDYEIEVRPGERTRCANFCPVNAYCQQWRDYQDGWIETTKE